MKLDKNLLLIIAIIAIGLFVLPSTLSMFAGQHSWYDPADEISCQKCHFLEGEELAAGGPHSSTYETLLNTSAQYNGTAVGVVGGEDFWGGSLDSDRCYGCHQRQGTYNETFTAFLGETNQWNASRNESHAAVSVLCSDCHPWVVTELNNTNEAHTEFYEQLNDSGTGTLKAANQACIGCHTHVGVNISWTRAAYVSYNVTVDAINQTYGVSWNTSDNLGENATRFNSSSGY